MSSYLGINGDLLIADNCHRTAREIAGQPHLWSETAEVVAQKSGTNRRVDQAPVGK